MQEPWSQLNILLIFFHWQIAQRFVLQDTKMIQHLSTFEWKSTFVCGYCFSWIWNHFTSGSRKTWVKLWVLREWFQIFFDITLWDIICGEHHEFTRILMTFCQETINILQESRNSQVTDFCTKVPSKVEIWSLSYISCYHSSDLMILYVTHEICVVLASILFHINSWA